MGIWEHINIQIVIAVSAFVGTIITFSFQLGRISKRIDIIDDSLKTVRADIEFFHGTCDTVKSKLSQGVTLGMLKEHCSESQDKCTQALCRKISEVKEDLKDLKSETKHHAQSLNKIEHFMGKIEGMLESAKK